LHEGRNKEVLSEDRSEKGFYNKLMRIGPVFKKEGWKSGVELVGVKIETLLEKQNSHEKIF